MYVFNTGRYFVKNATLDASAAADTAENEPKEVYLRFTEGKPANFCTDRQTMQLVLEFWFDFQSVKATI